MKKQSFDAAIFDMDGVITKTASVHADAWKLVFDEYMQLRAKRENETFREFTHDDYLNYVDGKPRLKGIQSFLNSRNIDLPMGSAEDQMKDETVYGIGNTKNKKFRQVLKEKGVEVYEPCVKLIKQFKQEGIKVGVVSSSKNCKFILEAAGVLDLFDTRVDGVIAQELGLEGKPEGDIFVRAALDLDTLPKRSIVFEDAISGVQAGRNGGFRLVVGVARSENREDLNKNGADVVVSSLEILNMAWIEKWCNKEPVSLFENWDDENAIEQAYAPLKIKESIMQINPRYLSTPESIFKKGKNPVFFLDYDGTLTPIVERPELAVISESMKNTVLQLSKKFKTAIVSGRMREDVEKLAQIKDIFYAGSHGFDIKGSGISMIHKEAEEIIPLINETITSFKQQFSNVEGVIIEEKKFSVAVHYRLVKDEQLILKIRQFVNKTVDSHSSLRVMNGKKVFEILPAIDWNKGMAVRWIMKALNVSWEDSCVVYIGDDTTDEDAFRVVSSRGVGILVSDQARKSAAQFRLSCPEEVEKFFNRLTA